MYYGETVRQKVKTEINKYHSLGIFKKGILVGCSGGSDSVALLLILRSLSEEYEFNIEVICVDHGLRVESEFECLKVKELCKREGLTFHMDKLPKLNKVSEEILRNMRIDIFKDILKKRGLGLIATGHTIDDQAETILMRIIRGSGLKGISGMDVLNPPFFRPLLRCYKEELQNFLKENQTKWCEDSSNSESLFFRNRIRNSILPAIKEENPNIINALTNLGAIAGENFNYIERQTYELRKNCIIFREGLIIQKKLLVSSDVAILYPFIRNLWSEYSTDGEFGREHTITFHNWLFSTSTSLSLPGKVITEKIGDFIYLGREFIPVDFSIKFNNPDELITGQIKTAVGELQFVRDSSSEKIIIPSTSWPITLRTKKPGDRISRKGMGMVRMKKVHQNFPQRIKELFVVIEDCNGVILWAEEGGKAFAIDDGGKSIEISLIKSCVSVDIKRTYSFPAHGVENNQ